MSAFLVSSGEMKKNIFEQSPKLVAMEALRQWKIVPRILSTVLAVREDGKGEIYFSTATLLNELGLKYKVHNKSVQFD